MPSSSDSWDPSNSSNSSESSRHLAAVSPPLLLVVAAGNPARCRALRALVGTSGFVFVPDATSPAELESAVVRHHPGAVLLDTDLAAGGLESIERVMASVPTPIVVCGAAAEQPRAALRAGAVSALGIHEAVAGSGAYVIALRRHLQAASRVPVITQPRGSWRGQPVQARDSPPVRPRAPALESVSVRPLRVVPEGPDVTLRVSAAASAQLGCEVVVIGASTGGPPALARILGALPADFDVPILVVQHMADGFVEGLAAWLSTVSSLPVSLVADGVRLKPGTVSIAPAGCNVVVHRRLRIELLAPFPNQFHIPGIDVTFSSVAGSCGARCLGVLLTGMGRDGAAGLRAMRVAGAMTIAQDEATSAVYGMPAAAVALDAVGLQLPLPDIAAALRDLVARPAAPQRGRRP